jgi:hypothetical protein
MCQECAREIVRAADGCVDLVVEFMAVLVDCDA